MMVGREKGMPVLQNLSLHWEANQQGTEGRCCCGTLPL